MREPVGSSFTVTGLKAGASDSIRRLGTVHDVVSFYLPALAFVLPDYSNYHCPDVDFLRLFGVRDLPGTQQAPDAPVEEVTLTLSQLVEKLWDRSFVPRDRSHYVISADIYHSPRRRHPLLARMEIRDGLRFSFLDRLRYDAGASPFGDDPGTHKAVLHLRRKDICGSVRMDDGTTLRDRLPQLNLFQRTLLTIPDAVAQLENILPPGAAVDLVVASDGLDWLDRQFRNIPEAATALQRLDDGLRAPVTSDRLSIRLCGRLIGVDPDITLRTLDAIYHADTLVTQSSSFGGLIAHIGNTRILRSDGRGPAQPHMTPVRSETA